MGSGLYHRSHTNELDRLDSRPVIVHSVAVTVQDALVTLGMQVRKPSRKLELISINRDTTKSELFTLNRVIRKVVESIDKNHRTRALAYSR